MGRLLDKIDNALLVRINNTAYLQDFEKDYAIVFNPQVYSDFIKELMDYYGVPKFDPNNWRKHIIYTAPEIEEFIIIKKR